MEWISVIQIYPNEFEKVHIINLFGQQDIAIYKSNYRNIPHAFCDPKNFSDEPIYPLVFTNVVKWKRIEEDYL